MFHPIQTHALTPIHKHCHHTHHMRYPSFYIVNQFCKRHPLFTLHILHKSAVMLLQDHLTPRRIKRSCCSTETPPPHTSQLSFFPLLQQDPINQTKSHCTHVIVCTSHDQPILTKRLQIQLLKNASGKVQLLLLYQIGVFFIFTKD